ncbi:hypothetical protein [Streptomyces griseocarneus]|uniref:hypothetical protein n=1 Tax=Streptomyces griseocarneus TaxID=51201 RepID=UPI00167ECF92|nr:hypothetical protein [Streptomyces griseocarneus]MBZ6476780.1 hypothetical protein [Streptomyces griseocarneus]
MPAPTPPLPPPWTPPRRRVPLFAPVRPGGRRGRHRRWTAAAAAGLTAVVVCSPAVARLAPWHLG